jgi:hypothetical protein
MKDYRQTLIMYEIETMPYMIAIAIIQLEKRSQPRTIVYSDRSDFTGFASAALTL